MIIVVHVLLDKTFLHYFSHQTRPTYTYLYKYSPKNKLQLKLKTINIIRYISINWKSRDTGKINFA